MYESFYMTSYFEMEQQKHVKEKKIIMLRLVRNVLLLIIDLILQIHIKI